MTTRKPSRGAAAGKKTETKGGYVPPLTITLESLLTEGTDAGFRSTVYLMNMVLSRLQTCRETFGRTLGLTATQFAVLLGVAHQQKQDGISVRALAEHISIAPSHVTTEVRRLVDMGLLNKDQSSDDGRSVLVTLTKLGQQRVAEVSPLLRKVNDHLFAGVSARDFEVFTRCLATVAGNSELAVAELKRFRMQAGV